MKTFRYSIFVLYVSTRVYQRKPMPGGGAVSGLSARLSSGQIQMEKMVWWWGSNEIQILGPGGGK